MRVEVPLTGLRKGVLAELARNQGISLEQYLANLLEKEMDRIASAEVRDSKILEQLFPELQRA